MGGEREGRKIRIRSFVFLTERCREREREKREREREREKRDCVCVCVCVCVDVYRRAIGDTSEEHFSHCVKKEERERRPETVLTSKGERDEGSARVFHPEIRKGARNGAEVRQRREMWRRREREREGERGQSGDRRSFARESS